MSLATKGLTDELFWEGALSRSSMAIKSHNFTINFVKYRYCLQGSSRYVSVL